MTEGYLHLAGEWEICAVWSKKKRKEEKKTSTRQFMGIQNYLLLCKLTSYQLMAKL